MMNLTFLLCIWIYIRKHATSIWSSFQRFVAFQKQRVTRLRVCYQSCYQVHTLGLSRVTYFQSCYWHFQRNNCYQISNFPHVALGLCRLCFILLQKKSASTFDHWFLIFSFCCHLEFAFSHNPHCFFFILCANFQLKLKRWFYM